MLRRTAFRLTTDWHEADDLAQRTLIALYGRWETLEDRDRISAYAHTILIRLLIDDRRASRWSNEILSALPPETAAVADPASRVEDRLLMLEALSGLAPRQQAAVVLRYYEDRSVDETARALGCGHSTVRSQTTRALAFLRAVLDRDGTRIGTTEEAPGDQATEDEATAPH